MKRQPSVGAIALVLVLATLYLAGVRVTLASGGDKSTVTSTFAVEGMTCGGCEAAIEIKLRKIDGVGSAEASHEKDSAVVRYDPTKVTPDRIVSAIEDLGYKARLVETQSGDRR